MYAAGASFNIVVCLFLSLSCSAVSMYVYCTLISLVVLRWRSYALLNCYDKWFSQYCAQSGSHQDEHYLYFITLPYLREIKYFPLVMERICVLKLDFSLPC